MRDIQEMLNIVKQVQFSISISAVDATYENINFILINIAE